MVAPERNHGDDVPPKDEEDGFESSGVDYTPPPFDRVYQEHVDFVWRVVRRMGVAESALEDVTQEVFVVVHRRLHEFEGRSAVRTWLYSIARGVAANHRRSHKRHRYNLEIDEAKIESSSDPQSDLMRSNAARLLDELLANLDESKREVLMLADLEGMTLKEISELLEQPVTTLHSRLQAAREALNKAIARHRLAEERRSK